MPPVHRAFVATVVVSLLAGSSIAAKDPPPRTGGSPPASEHPATDDDALGMSKAVVCRTIDGYEDYTPLPGAAQTSEEKLLVYYRPLRFRVEKNGGLYRAHLTQDGRLRRKGQKAVIYSRTKMLEYEPKSESSFDHCYLRSLVSLKGLKPGEYEFDIILHDELVKGATATQTVSFRVVPVAPAETGKEDSSDHDSTPAKPKTKSKD
jgi:hypothetical protein